MKTLQIILISLVLVGQAALIAHATEVKLTASDAATDDEFGHSVSISDDYAIVGAARDDNFSGSTYIFYRNQGGSNNWGQQKKLTASDAEAYDYFGNSVSTNGDYAIVGASYNDDDGYNSGSAYIFYRNKDGENNWGQQKKLTASDATAEDYFGHVSISGDHVIIGALSGGNNTGSAYSFLRSGSSWSQKERVIASDGAAFDYFGRSVSISGNYTIVGAYNDHHSGKSNAGSAYIYHSINDFSLPVELSVFTATTSGDNVILRWRTETEVNNLGFGVYRSTEKDGGYVKITFVSGAGSTPMPTDYQFMDKKVEFGKTYYYFLEDIDIAGVKNRNMIIKVVVPSAKPVGPIPEKFRLLQNYPNPFNPDTWIPYELAKEAAVTIRIYDVRGQLVRQLDLGAQKAGRYIDKEKTAYWNGKGQTGNAVSSGLYFYTLKAGDFQETKKMVIAK